MSERIRPATAADAPFLARMALLSSRGHMPWGFHDVRMPGTDEEILRKLEGFAIASSASYFHFSHRIVLEVDGVPAASLGALTNDASFARNLEAARREVLGDPGYEELVRLSAPLVVCFIDPPDESWGIELVACDPAYRRRGLVSRLLDAALAKGSALGHTSAALSVEIDNHPARLAYEKHGFQIAAEKRDPGFEAVMGSPGIWLMTREL
jgi:translation initiation factor 4G